MNDHESTRHGERPDFAGKCESCGMPIEGGPYCEHCVGPDGSLQEFAERFRRMTDFAMQQDPCIGRDVAEERTRAYMATMPAWRNHPELEGSE